MPYIKFEINLTQNTRWVDRPTTTFDWMNAICIASRQKWYKLPLLGDNLNVNLNNFLKYQYYSLPMPLPLHHSIACPQPKACSDWTFVCWLNRICVTDISSFQDITYPLGVNQSSYRSGRVPGPTSRHMWHTYDCRKMCCLAFSATCYQWSRWAVLMGDQPGSKGRAKIKERRGRGQPPAVLFNYSAPGCFWQSYWQ